jgi:hypothetical protein
MWNFPSVLPIFRVTLIPTYQLHFKSTMKKFRLLSTLLLACSAALNAQSQQEFSGAQAAKICLPAR